VVKVALAVVFVVVLAIGFAIGLREYALVLATAVTFAVVLWKAWRGWKAELANSEDEP
jgi:hypothetical protein